MTSAPEAHKTAGVVARSDAAFDGRNFDALSKADRDRYLARAMAGLAAIRSIPSVPAVAELSGDVLPQSIAGAAEGNNLVSYLARHIAWSRETFGPGTHSKGLPKHIAKELREIEADPFDLVEWVDVISLAMDGFWRHGGKAEDLVPMLNAKLDVNLGRQWPDWRVVGEDNAIEHVRTLSPSVDDPDAGNALARTEDGGEVERLREGCTSVLRRLRSRAGEGLLGHGNRRARSRGGALRLRLVLARLSRRRPEGSRQPPRRSHPPIPRSRCLQAGGRTMSALPVKPRYDVGDVVAYTDRQDRRQTGKVRAVEASWRYQPGAEPLVIYDLEHPTYRNRRFYTTDERIHGLSNQEPSHG